MVVSCSFILQSNKKEQIKTICSVPHLIMVLQGEEDFVLYCLLYFRHYPVRPDLLPFPGQILYLVLFRQRENIA